MHLSSKISNSLLIYLERRGEDLSQALEQIEFPEEFMRDPSYWVDADTMESWLQLFADRYAPIEGNCLVCEAGAHVHELRSWGVLDSVLRMMPRPQEIMNQPEKFLGYFISPIPIIGKIQKEENGVRFSIPDFAEKYPLSFSFLIEAFSALPIFVGQARAKCEWSEGVFSLNWAQTEPTLVPEGESLGHQISPELLQSVINQLEQNQRELEKRNQELVMQNQTIEEAHQHLKASVNLHVYQEKMRGLSEFAEVISKDLQVPANSLAQQFLKMQDFMVRAQQVITILKSSGKPSPILIEALKRVDWDRAKDAFKDSLQDGELALLQIRHLSAELKRGSQSSIAAIQENKENKINQNSRETDQRQLEI